MPTLVSTLTDNPDGTPTPPPSPTASGEQLSPQEYYQRTGITPVGAPPKILPRSTFEDFFKSKGLPSYIAQGIGDATYMESGAPGGGYNTTAVNPKSGASGIFQDLGPRKDRLLSQPNWQTGNTQLENAWSELQGPEKAAFEKLKTAKTREEAAKIWRDSFERPGPVGSKVATADWNVDPHAILTQQGRSDTTVVGMSPAEYLALTPDVEDTSTNKAKKLSLEKSIKAGDMIEDIPSLDVKGGRVYDQDGRHRAMLAQQQGVDLIPVALHGITGGALPEKIAGMKGNELPVQWKPWPAVKPDMNSAYAAQQGTPEHAAAAAQNRRLFGEGVGSAIGEGANLLEHILPTKVSTAVNKLNNYLVSKGVPLPTVPPGGVAQMEQERQNQIRSDTTPDPMGLRTAGEVAVTLPMAGEGVIGGMLGGAASAALQPVQNPNENYLSQKLGQIGSGAATGGVVGVGGNILSRVISPVRAPAQSILMNEGVRLTPGQMAGGLAKRAEDVAGSIPILGAGIRAGRNTAVEDLNRAAWNRVLKHFGEKLPKDVPVGRDAAEYVGDKINEKYADVIPNLKARPDTTFVNELQRIASRARVDLPDSQFTQLARLIHSEFTQKVAGKSGESLQGVDIRLGQEAKGYRGSQDYNDRKLGNAIGDVHLAFRDLLARQNPKYATKLNALREGFKDYVRVAKASSAPGTEKTGGVFDQRQLASAVRSEDVTARKTAYGKGKARMQDLSDAASRALSSTVSPSSTLERFALVGGIGALLGGEVYGHGLDPATLAGLAVASLPYTKGGMNLLRQFATFAPKTRAVLSQVPRQSVPMLATIGGAMAGAPTSQATPLNTVTP